jgi:hypothetical protein
MMYPYGEHMSGWGYALGIIGMVLFWAVLALAIAGHRRRCPLPGPQTPRELPAPAAHG